MKLEFTEKADADLAEIWAGNAERYGLEHADKYRSFLIQEIQHLTQNPQWGKLVEDFPRLRCLVIKRRASGHGHRAYYESFDDTIRVVRVLHTAMNAPDHIEN